MSVTSSAVDACTSQQVNIYIKRTNETARTHPRQLLSDAGDLAQLALGNELEHRIEHRAEDRNVQPAGVVGHVEAGALSLAQPVDVAAQGRRRHGEGEPDPGPDLAGAVVDGPVGVPLVEVLVVGVGLVGRVEDEHDGGPDGPG